MNELIFWLKENYRFQSKNVIGLLDELITEIDEYDVLHIIANIIKKLDKGLEVEYDVLILLKKMKNLKK
ncbi:MAG: hypothetical protein RSF67_10195 [Clostridia bacterium]